MYHSCIVRVASLHNVQQETNWTITHERPHKAQLCLLLGPVMKVQQLLEQVSSRDVTLSTVLSMGKKKPNLQRKENREKKKKGHRPSRSPSRRNKKQKNKICYLKSQILKNSALAQAANLLPNMDIFPNQFFTNRLHSPQRLGVFQSVLRVQDKPSIGHTNILII